MEPKYPNQGPPPLTISTLLALLNTPAELEGKVASTLSPGDTAKVLLRGFFVGSLIQQLDQDEEFLHVEFCNDDTKQWCEIWTTREWKESNTRRTAFRQRSESERIEYNKKSERLKKLQAALTAKGLAQKPGWIEHNAEAIYNYWKAGKYNEMFKILELVDLFKTFEEEDK